MERLYIFEKYETLLNPARSAASLTDSPHGGQQLHGIIAAQMMGIFHNGE